MGAARWKTSVMFIREPNPSTKMSANRIRIAVKMKMPFWDIQVRTPASLEDSLSVDASAAEDAVC